MSDLFCSPTYLNSGKRHSIMSNDAMYYMRNIPNIAIGMGMPCSTHQKPSPMGALRIYKGRTLAGNVTNLAPPPPRTCIYFPFKVNASIVSRGSSSNVKAQWLNILKTRITESLFLNR